MMDTIRLTEEKYRLVVENTSLIVWNWIPVIASPLSAKTSWRYWVTHIQKYWERSLSGSLMKMT
jgi:hypothetical protein